MRQCQFPHFGPTIGYKISYSVYGQHLQDAKYCSDMEPQCPMFTVQYVLYDENGGTLDLQYRSDTPYLWTNLCTSRTKNMYVEWRHPADHIWGMVAGISMYEWERCRPTVGNENSPGKLL
jgi:hypothetical protein